MTNDSPAATLIAVDPERLEAIERNLASVLSILSAANISASPEWVTVQKAASLLGVHPSTIRRKIDAGEIEAKGAGKTRRVRL